MVLPKIPGVEVLPNPVELKPDCKKLLWPRLVLVVLGNIEFVPNGPGVGAPRVFDAFPRPRVGGPAPDNVWFGGLVAIEARASAKPSI